MKNGLRKEEIEHFRDNSKKPQKRPQFQPPKPQKNTRANTPRVIFITSRTNLTINEKPHSEGRRHTTRDSRFRIKSAWFTPSAGRGLYQPPF